MRHPRIPEKAKTQDPVVLADTGHYHVFMRIGIQGGRGMRLLNRVRPNITQNCTP
jgi:hypothetical protein